MYHMGIARIQKKIQENTSHGYTKSQFCDFVLAVFNHLKTTVHQVTIEEGH